MKRYAIITGLILLLLTCVALICYSPLASSIYEDWKKARGKSQEAARIAALLEANSEVKTFTFEGGNLFASDLDVQLKLLSETNVGVMVELAPAHPVRATSDDSYIFTLLLEDADGFDLREIIVNEWEMMPMVSGDGGPISLTFESSVSMPPEQYTRISGIKIAYSSPPARKALYETLRKKTAEEIDLELKAAEDEAVAALLEELAANRRAQEEAEAARSKQLAAIAEAREAEAERAQEVAAEIAKAQEEERRKLLEARQLRKMAWDQIRQGLTWNRVEELLGQPEAVNVYSWATVLNFEVGAAVSISRSGVVESYRKPY